MSVITDDQKHENQLNNDVTSFNNENGLYQKGQKQPDFVGIWRKKGHSLIVSGIINYFSLCEKIMAISQKIRN